MCLSVTDECTAITTQHSIVLEMDLENSVTLSFFWRCIFQYMQQPRSGINQLEITISGFGASGLMHAHCGMKDRLCTNSYSLLEGL